ncbi:hypothetical protein Ae201684P_022401 [Aphanomyces euteiches]|nr:hypothetical protein Ae201684P_022401 [Aphanomyces euteiches]
MKLKLQLNLFDVPVPGADVESLVGDEARNTSKGTTTSSSSMSTALIVGIGAGAVCLCAIVAFFVYQRRYKRRMNDISIIGGKDDQFVIVNDRGSVTYRHL